MKQEMPRIPNTNHKLLKKGSKLILSAATFGVVAAGSFQGVKRFPCFIQQLADFLGCLRWKLFIPQILSMGFFLIIPVRVFLHSHFFVMLTFVITDIPELGCRITHMSDDVCIFLTDLYGCFL